MCRHRRGRRRQRSRRGRMGRRRHPDMEIRGRGHLSEHALRESSHQRRPLLRDTRADGCREAVSAPGRDGHRRGVRGYGDAAGGVTDKLPHQPARL